MEGYFMCITLAISWQSLAKLLILYLAFENVIGFIKRIKCAKPHEVLRTPAIVSGE